MIQEEDISLDRVYFDPLIRPASTNPGQAKFILDTIVTIKREFPQAHIALGLSNISFGLPARNNLNKVFLSMLIAAGCDGAILDPCEPGMITTLFSAQAVLGLDEYGMNYIFAYRGGQLK
jgi:5-methyltetrahydrofolate--homocysteine methyltransferase